MQHDFEAPYRAIIKDAAARLERALFYSGGGRAYVVAIPTRSAQEPGRLEIITENEPTPPGGAIVRPLNGDSWNAVPRGALFSVLWDACRREPILPIEDAAQ